jgi:serine/threonine-protein kinase RsbW
METVSFPGRFESLPEIGRYIESVAKSAGLNDKAVYAVQLAVDEACANIIDHAYGGENKGDIYCTVIPRDEGLTIILRDRGRPYNPQHVPDPQFNVPLDKLKPRGVGVFLMRKMMDEVRFEYSPEGGNVLTLFKKKRS